MTTSTSSPLQVVIFVIGILDELGVRYHLGGSFASAIHGVPRQTMDADLVVDLDSHTVNDLVSRMKEGFYIDLDVAVEAVSKRASFNAIHLDSGFKVDFFVNLDSGFKVDFFVKGDSDFDQVEFERAVSCQIVDDPPFSAYVKSAEDTILRKLLWFRDGGEVSDRQWSDVLGILLAIDDLDMDHIGQWAAKLGLQNLLNRALNEVEKR
jgi:hypothetical protein